MSKEYWWRVYCRVWQVGFLQCCTAHASTSTNASFVDNLVISFACLDQNPPPIGEQDYYDQLAANAVYIYPGRTGCNSYLSHEPLPDLVPENAVTLRLFSALGLTVGLITGEKRWKTEGIRFYHIVVPKAHF